MTNSNLQSLNDDDLDQLRRDVLCEQERRANLTAIPHQVADLCATYRAGGGDPEVLREAIGTDQDASQ